MALIWIIMIKVTIFLLEKIAKLQEKNIKAKILEIFNVKIKKTKPLRFINKDLSTEPIIEHIKNDKEILKSL